MVPTVLLVEYSRLTGWLPCGKKANGRGGLEESIVGGTLVSSVRDMMVAVVQIMARHAPSAVMSFRGLFKLLITEDGRSVVCSYTQQIRVNEN